ncbi:MAG: hypothetical protein LBD23_13645 [Oscillospiraceae bacterium]|jgi:hypothetical protein|nr:hypothetical protein [Oscillospiraceae bacterium]
MAIVREDGRYVNSLYIDENYEGRSVLLSFKGEKLPIGYGYLTYSSDAKTDDETRADQSVLLRLLVDELKADGKITSGWGGDDKLCVLSI